MRDEGVSEGWLDKVDRHIGGVYKSPESTAVAISNAVIKALCEELENDE
jgi:hypothetical protein